MKQTVLISILFGLIGTAMMGAENGKLSGKLYGDYYYFIGSHDADLEGRNGFWLRKVYLTYEGELNKHLSFRVRLEAEHPDGLSKDADKAVPFVKDAYVNWKTGSQQILLGISENPIWKTVEKFWGYRSVEKTPLDLQGWGSSRDVGVAVKGRLDKAGKLQYHFMVGNGNGYRSDGDKGKKAMLSLGFYPSPSLVLEIYGDWNDRPQDTDWTTLQAFAAYKSEKAGLGLQWAHQTRRGEPDLELRIASLFGTLQLGPRTALLGRVDRMFDPNPKGATISFLPFHPGYASTLFLGGLEVKAHEKLSLIPNITVVSYDKPDRPGEIRPEADVVLKLTCYFKF